MSATELPTVTPPTQPSSLNPYDKDNYITLADAIKSGRACLISAIRLADNAPVALICAINPAVNSSDGELHFVPLAVMVEVEKGNPYEQYRID